MKKYIGWMLVGWLLGLTGCNQEIDTWSGKDVIYLDMMADSTVVSFTYIDSKYVYDTVYVYARVIGEVTNTPRELRLSVQESNAVPGVDYAPLAETYVVEGERNFCVIPVILIRSEALKEQEKYFTLALEENEYFTLLFRENAPVAGADDKTSKITHRILFSELMKEPPITWAEYQFGTFSPEKFKTICDVMEIPREKFVDSKYMSPGRKNFIAIYMKDYFARMKEAGTPVLEKDGSEMKMGDKI